MKKRLEMIRTLVGQPLWVVAGFGISAIAVVMVFRDALISSQDGDQLLLGLVVNAITYAVALFIVILPIIIMKRTHEVTALLGLADRPKLIDFAKTVGVYFLYFFVLVVVMALGMALLSNWVDFEQEQDIGISADMLTQTYQYVLAFATLVILPPIFEELLFRGYLYGKLRRQFGFWLSAIVSSVTFGFVHGQINVAIDTFILGMFLAYLRESTGSIWPAVFLHAIKNGVAYYVLFILKVG